MGNNISLISKTSFIHFEELQENVLHTSNNMVLINTFSKDNQHCLIQNTLSIDEEEKEINTLLRIL